MNSREVEALAEEPPDAAVAPLEEAVEATAERVVRLDLLLRLLVLFVARGLRAGVVIER